jgi:hypothetical protein
MSSQSEGLNRRDTSLDTYLKQKYQADFLQKEAI